MKKHTIRILLILFTSNTAFAAEHIIGMKNWKFSPDQLTIELGDTVTFDNNDDSYHSVVFEDSSIKPSSLIKPEKKFIVKFDKTGEFAFFCKPHHDYDMKGKIIVKDHK